VLKYLSNIAIILLVGVWVAFLVQFDFAGYLNPTQPYTKVTIIKSEVEDRDYVLTATFFKNTCKFNSLYVSAFDGKEWDTLAYRDEKPLGDRVIGWHTFTIKVALPFINPYELLQVRTRHECTKVVDNIVISETVDKIFHTHVFE